MAGAARFEAFVREYQDLVFATAVRLLGRPADAEVFMRAFQRFDDLAASPAVAGWLRTVTTNLCLNHLTRYRRRWQFFSEIDAAADDAPGSFEASLPAGERGHEDAERRVRLERALADLPDHQRVPIVLFHFQDYSQQQIAAALGVSIAKVKTDLHRGRIALKRAVTAPEAER
jgi:RNA polymerase sigma-70 factor (ECF subfamily)